MFYFPDIKLKEIKFKFSGLFKPIKKYTNEEDKNSTVSLINLDDFISVNKTFFLIVLIKYIIIQI